MFWGQQDVWHYSAAEKEHHAHLDYEFFQMCYIENKARTVRTTRTSWEWKLLIRKEWFAKWYQKGLPKWQCDRTTTATQEATENLNHDGTHIRTRTGYSKHRADRDRTRRPENFQICANLQTRSYAVSTLSIRNHNHAISDASSLRTLSQRMTGLRQYRLGHDRFNH